MSYSSIHRCVNDGSFVGRVNACIAQEQTRRGDPPNPGVLSDPMRWHVASAADVEAAYAAALDAGTPDPGGDPTVITDGMILANVQANWT